MRLFSVETRHRSAGLPPHPVIVEPEPVFYLYVATHLFYYNHPIFSFLLSLPILRPKRTEGDGVQTDHSSSQPWATCRSEQRQRKSREGTVSMAARFTGPCPIVLLSMTFGFVGCSVLIACLLAGCASQRNSVAIHFEPPKRPFASITRAHVESRDEDRSVAVRDSEQIDSDAPDDDSSVMPVSGASESEAASESHPEPFVPPAPGPDDTDASQTIDLTTALLLTAGNSPQVAFARARIEEATAQLDRAEALWLPSIRAGANYNKHEGRIQDVAGNVIETSRGSFYSGFGANAVGAGSPAVPGLVASFHLTDAIFQPKIAERTAAARLFASQAAANDALLRTALAYEDLLRAAQDLAIAKETQEHAQELARVTGEFARTGQGLESDNDRARTELALRTNDRYRAEEALEIASARLAEQIRWDANQRLAPAEANIVPIQLVNIEMDKGVLIATALQQRPEISESRQLIAEACERLRREKYAPLIPSVLLGVSYGGMGGGLGSDLTNYGDRLDADAVAYWEIRNLGFGERAARREAHSRIDQARSRELAELDRVAREVVEAHAQVLSRQKQIESARNAVAAAEISYKRNVERIQNGQGLPIEVLQAIQALATSRREYLRAVADYNAAQFTLHRSLGWPIQM